MSDELVLEPTDPKRRRKRQTPADKLKSPSLTVRLEGVFEAEYEQCWKIPYFQTTPGEDRKKLKQLGEQLGEAGAVALIREFFVAVRPVTQGGDPVVSRCRFSNVRDLSFQTQYLLLQRSRGPQLSDRTATNIAEVARATGRGRR